MMAPTAPHIFKLSPRLLVCGEARFALAPVRVASQRASRSVSRLPYLGRSAPYRKTRGTAAGSAWYSEEATGGVVYPLATFVR